MRGKWSAFRHHRVNRYQGPPQYCYHMPKPIVPYQGKILYGFKFSTHLEFNKQPIGQTGMIYSWLSFLPQSLRWSSVPCPLSDRKAKDSVVFEWWMFSSIVTKSEWFWISAMTVEPHTILIRSNTPAAVGESSQLKCVIPEADPSVILNLNLKKTFRQSKNQGPLASEWRLNVMRKNAPAFSSVLSV